MRRLAIFGLSSIVVGGVALVACAGYAYGSVRTFEDLTGFKFYDLARLYRVIDGQRLLLSSTAGAVSDAS